VKLIQHMFLIGLLLSTAACAQEEGITSAINPKTQNAKNGGIGPENKDWANGNDSTTETAADGREVNTTAFPTYPPMPVACDSAPYAVRGSFISGVTTLDVGGRPVEIWYPAESGSNAGVPADTYDMRDFLPIESAQQIPDDIAPLHIMDAYRDIPMSGQGPFPVLLFSHGVASYRLQSSFLMTHLASWGFIVASTEHPERGLAALLAGGMPNDNAVAQLQETITRLQTENASTESFFFGQMDLERMGAFGHSAGGAAVGALAGANTVRAWATLASAGFKAAPEKDALVMGGTNDQFATSTLVRDSFDKYDAGDKAKKRFVSIAEAGHLAFTDLCVIGKEQGGVLAIAQQYGLEVPPIVVSLANDGCLPTDLPVQEAWTIINHYVTAHFKASLGIVEGHQGLTASSTSCFAPRIADSSFERNQVDEEDLRPPRYEEAGTRDSRKGKSEGANKTPGNLIEVAQSAGQFNALLAAVEAADLTETLKGPGIYTVFAPTDAAFDLIEEEALNALLADKDTLSNVLLYHVSGGLLSSAVVSNLPSLTMVNEEEVEISVEDDIAYIDDSAIVQTNIAASNGVIHAIDAVLFPSKLLSIATESSDNSTNDSTDDIEDPNEGVVNCGEQSCDIQTNTCCVGLGGQSCKAECGLFQAAQSCDGPEDCEGEQVCCVGFPAGSSCNPGCKNGQEMLCHGDDDCPEGMACESCSFPGSPPTNVCKAKGC